MKGLFIISTLDTGGAQRVLSNLTLNLPADWEIDILLNDDASISFPYRGRVITLGMKPREDRTSAFYQFRVMLRRIYKLRRLKRNGYDFALSFMDSANFANILSGSRRCKTIASVHIHLTETCKDSARYRLLVAPMARLLYRKTNVIVTVSDGVKADLSDNFGIDNNKIHTIYNGFDASYIRKRASQMPVDGIGVDENCFNIITVGRLTHQKGQWHLIRAFSEIHKKYNYARLYILGTGELESYLKELIVDYGLDDSVIMGGFLDNPHAVMSRSDLFVFPSLFEGLGNALIEAMILGLPCVTTDYDSGAREIFAYSRADVAHEPLFAKYGVVCPVPSGTHHKSSVPLEPAEKCIKEAIAKLIDDERLRASYSKAAKKRAEDFTIERAIAQWKKII